ncbi:MAG: hypothetical protein K2X03_21915 [Bryobacteraceae bacterium]|nr:hypothetical protein [Bryobacteraceae bacterium]
MALSKTGKIGSSFDGFLAAQGILNECEERAIQQILVDQIKVWATDKSAQARTKRSQRL